MAYDQVFPTDSTSKLIEVMVRDSTTGAGKTGLAFGSVTFAYWREGAGSGVTATCVDMTLGTWTTKGWKEVDATNQKGVYQFGVPNGALATGAAAVTINFQASGMIDKSVRILLSSPTRGLAGPTALPDAAAAGVGGLAIVGSAMTLEDAALTAAKFDGVTTIAPGWNSTFIPETLRPYGVATTITMALLSLLGNSTVTGAIWSGGGQNIACYLMTATGLTPITTVTEHPLLSGVYIVALTDVQMQYADAIVGVLPLTLAARPAWQSIRTYGASGGITALPVAAAGAVGGLALVGSAMAVPTDQAVNVTKIGGQAVTCGAPVTVPASIGTYTGTPPTAADIKTALEAAGGHLALILEDTGTTLPATLTEIGETIAGIETGSGLTAQETANAVHNLAPVGPLAANSMGMQLDNIETKTNTLGASSISIVYPIAQDGTITLQVGDDYQTAEGYELNWIDAGNTWPDLTAAVIVFKVSSLLTLNGTVIVASGTGKKVRVILSKTDTIKLAKGTAYYYNVRATLSNGHEVTLVRRSRLQTGKDII